jgi:hypothetical protein
MCLYIYASNNFSEELFLEYQRGLSMASDTIIQHLIARFGWICLQRAFGKRWLYFGQFSFDYTVGSV